MKILNVKPPEGLFGRALTTALLFLSLAVAAPFAQAATSGNATIFNEATVSYTSGGSTLTASDDISVTVITLAAAPSISVNTTAQTVDGGANALYNYTVRSNANGVDDYSLSLASVDNAFVSASTDAGVPASVNLWGGIVLSSGAGTINLPGGSTTGLANGDTVELTVAGNPEQYTVTITNAGSAEASGSAEVEAVLTLAPIGGSPAITGANVVVGAQVGEYTGFTLTQTAGTPNTPGTDGTHTNNISGSTTATDALGAVVNYTTSAAGLNETITTVNSPAITIAKLWRNVTTGTTFGAPGAGAKPGEVIEYQITVTGDPGATVTDVYLTDIIPNYTAINTGIVAAPYSGADVYITYTDVAGAGANDYTTTATIANDGDQAEEIPAGTLQVTVGDGAGDAGVPTGGTLDAGDIAVVIFQVTVQ
jgi:uncharacterized repeat protein (TIGR01451 family)